MRNVRRGAFLAAAILACAAANAFAQDAAANAPALLPKPVRVVSDFAGVLTPTEVAALEKQLQELQDASLAEGIVYIAPSLPEGASMEELTLRSVNAWGVGNAATNNGIAIFAFIADRRIRIELGLGLESKISNADAQSIIDRQIAPAFRAGDYARGLSDAIREVGRLLRLKEGYVATALGPARRISGAAKAPAVLRRVNPTYPDRARQTRTQGVVQLQVLINQAGDVVDATVTKEAPYGLSEAAAAAVKQWRFAPVIEDGRPVPALIDVVIVFRL